MSGFQRAADATLDISATSFGLAPLQLAINDSPIRGIGSIASTWTGYYRGKIAFNSMEDMTGKRYKLECSIVESRLQIIFLDPKAEGREVKIQFRSDDSVKTTDNVKQAFNGIIEFN